MIYEIGHHRRGPSYARGEDSTTLPAVTPGTNIPMLVQPNQKSTVTASMAQRVAAATKQPAQKSDKSDESDTGGRTAIYVGLIAVAALAFYVYR